MLDTYYLAFHAEMYSTGHEYGAKGLVALAETKLTEALTMKKRCRPGDVADKVSMLWDEGEFAEHAQKLKRLSRELL